MDRELVRLLLQERLGGFLKLRELCHDHIPYKLRIYRIVAVNDAVSERDNDRAIAELCKHGSMAIAQPCQPHR